MRKRKARKSCSFSLPLEDLLEITESESEEHFYQQVFSGNSSSVKPIWFTARESSVEEYWTYNCPYIRFCSRSISLQIPESE